MGMYNVQKDDSIFQLYDKMFGPFTIDLFANNKNSRCKKFYARGGVKELKVQRPTVCKV